MSGNDSAFQVLIDKDSRRRAEIGANLSRLHATKSILSGGMNPRPAPLAQPPPAPFASAPPPSFLSAKPDSLFSQPPPPIQWTTNPRPTIPSATFSSTPQYGLPPQRQISRHSQRSYRRRSRGNGYDSGSDSDASTISMRSDIVRLVNRKLKEHAPESLRRIVVDDIIEEMKYNHQKGFPLPDDYDPEKHDMDENQIRLYKQQVMRARKRSQKKVTVFLNFAASGLSWFCQAMNFEWIKTKYLPTVIREAIDNGDFEDFTEGVGEVLKDTIFDHPLCSTALEFIKKVGDAHERQMEEENGNLGKKEENRKDRQRQFVNSLAKRGSASASDVSKKSATPVKKSTPNPISMDDLPQPPNESATSTTTTTTTTSSLSTTTGTDDSSTIQKKKFRNEV